MITGVFAIGKAPMAGTLLFATCSTQLLSVEVLVSLIPSRGASRKRFLRESEARRRKNHPFLSVSACQRPPMPQHGTMAEPRSKKLLRVFESYRLI